MEVEVKCRADVRALRRKLAGKARYVQTVRQKDYLLDYKDAKLKKKDQVFRVREEYVLHGPNWGEKRVFVTFKGKKRKAKLAKVREEVEEEVHANVEEVLAEAEGMGLRPRLQYEKIREYYQMKEASVEIDFFPQYKELGPFVEIEGKDERHIANVMKQLGLKREDVEPKSYPQLVQEHAKKRVRLKRAGRKAKTPLKSHANRAHGKRKK